MNDNLTSDVRAHEHAVGHARQSCQETSVSAKLRELVVGGIAEAVGLDDTLEQYASPRGDAGLFGPSSLTWVVHSDLPAMLIGGLASLMLQTLHPLTMAGIEEHSHFREDPLGRLRRTAEFVAGTTFGGTAHAEALIERVHDVHDRIHGIAPDGRVYCANDPELLTWVHTTEVWSFLRSFERYSAHPLTMSEKDRYLREVSTLAYRLGATSVPQSVAEVRAYFSDMRGELVGSKEAIATVAFLREPLSRAPLEVLAQQVVADAAIDLLPSFARRALRLFHVPFVSTAAARAGAGTFSALLRWAIGPNVLVNIARERAGAT
jgi:uncharacterized protein (DUF2236 family)